MAFFQSAPPIEQFDEREIVTRISDSERPSMLRRNDFASRYGLRLLTEVGEILGSRPQAGKN